MSVFFALDMTIGPRVSTSDPTCRVQKNSHFATSFIQDFFLISLRKAHIEIEILFKSAISIIFRDNNTNVTF
jgi:hypothetical protein